MEVVTKVNGRLIEFKYLSRVVGSCFCELLKGDSSDFCEFQSSKSNHRRLAFLPSHRDGRQIRRVGFYQDSVQGKLLRGLAKVLGGFEREDSRERNSESEFDTLKGEFLGSGEAVNHSRDGTRRNFLRIFS